MHPNRYVLGHGEPEETFTRFNKQLPEKPRTRAEFSVWRNQQRSLFMRLRDAAEADGEHDNAAYWAYYVNKYRNPKGRWMKKES